jgi:hypothetical protein
MKQEMDSLRQKVEELQRQLAKATKSEAVNGTVEPAPLNKKVEVLPQDPGESKRILDIIKEKDLENVKPPKKEKAPPKKEKAPPKKEKAPSRLLDVLREAEQERVTATATVTAPKKAAPKKKAAKKTAQKEKEVVIEEKEVVNLDVKVEKPANETSFFVEVEKPAPKAKAKNANDNVQVEVPKAENPWSTLSQSTLKRKTIKELADYLSERGVGTTHDDGTPLKKGDLVEAVLAL